MLDNQSMAALLEAFIAESDEGLTAAEEALLVLERTPEHADSLALVFRAVHTIKGNSGIFEFDAMTRIAHAMEDLLDRLRAGQTVVSNGIITLLLESVDVLRGLLFESDRTRALSAAELELIEHLRRADPLHVPAHDAAQAAGPATPERVSRTLRIDLAKLDRLLDLSGEIGIARGRLSEMLGDPTVTSRIALEAQRDADHLHLEMQELVMKLRMVPVGPTFRQFQRIVRDTARSLGKEAELRIEGVDVEVDMTVIEHLRDPLVHMIRNSVGHGIEKPAARRAAGKPAAGTLILRSFREAGSIVIELADDGGGIDYDRVIRRARERGLVSETETLTAAQAAELIFHPGFSTADAVTDLSGRGVGLDVVRRNIDAIHGSVSVESEPGRGTTFRVRLPLTLAIVDGLGVGVGGETFVIPMEAVVEALHLPAGTVEREEAGVGATGVLTHRGESIPFIRLRGRFTPGGGEAERENVVVVRYARGRAALVVDDLHGECHTVVKPLPKSLRGIPGLSGSAILPNGRIAFIVDVPGLLQVEIDQRSSLFRNSTRSNQERSCFVN
ncbi:MAG TPA: chemotaxis protein CheA [Thermoanaerobaculia bacterium]|nr:chemotaxis protein CheA [Thermoanaerobaculia bacterium]